MPITPDRLCSCHGEPMYVRVGTRKGNCVVKRRERVRRYQATEAGRRAKRRALAKFGTLRVFLGSGHFFTASTPAEAEAANAHIRRRLADFKAGHPCRLAETAERSVKSRP